jgi:hypothetical protein
LQFGISPLPSGGDLEDIKQLVNKPDFVFDMRLTREAMPSASHPHDFEPFDRGGGCLHRLKAARWPNDPFECAVVCLDDVVEVLARAVPGIGRQLAFSLKSADGLGIGAKLVCRNRGRRPVTHGRQRFSQEAMSCARVSPIHQHEVFQPAMFVDSTEQVLPATTDLHIALVHSPGGGTVSPGTTGPASQAQASSDGPSA